MHWAVRRKGWNSGSNPGWARTRQLSHFSYATWAKLRNLSVFGSLLGMSYTNVSITKLSNLLSIDSMPDTVQKCFIIDYLTDFLNKPVKLGVLLLAFHRQEN